MFQLRRPRQAEYNVSNNDLNIRVQEATEEAYMQNM